MIFKAQGTGEAVSFSPRAVIVAGFTGRNRTAVEAHIRELAAEGIAPPESVPAFYMMSPDLLSSAKHIEVSTAESSGEAEPVLLCHADRWYLTVGSDHTARDLERTDIARSKRACPKPVSTEVWPYEEVSRHWDRLELRSWARTDGRKVLYQEAPLSQLLAVPDILDALRQETEEQPEGAAIFLGTVPLRTHGFVFSDLYSVELNNPVTGQSLGFNYQVGNARRATSDTNAGRGGPRSFVHGGEAEKEE